MQEIIRSAHRIECYPNIGDIIIRGDGYIWIVLDKKDKYFPYTHFMVCRFERRINYCDLWAKDPDELFLCF